MKRILFVLLPLLFTLHSALGATAQVNSVIQLSGSGTSSPPSITTPVSTQNSSSGMFTIYCGTSSAGISANFYTPCYKNGVAYQVTAGKTFRVSSICSKIMTANGAWQFVSATASFGYNSGTALTGGVYQSGSASQGIMSGDSQTQAICQSYQYDFAGSTFVGVQNVSGASMTFMVAATGSEF